MNFLHWDFGYKEQIVNVEVDTGQEKSKMWNRLGKGEL